MNSQALIITIKNPQKGKVKTRLAATMGEERALDIYLALLAHTRRITSLVATQHYLFYSDFVDEKDEWPPRFFIKKLQIGKDIGERMANALEAVLQYHQKAVLVGSDIPGLSVTILELAFEKLSTHDFVIGPAADGGYYLVGMKAFEPSVFKGMTWSTDTVFEKTVEKIESLGKSWYRLPVLSDVDREEDWEKRVWGSE